MKTRFPIFFAPDGDNISAAGITVPVVPPPAAQPVQEVNLSPKVEKIDVAKELGIDSGVRSPADIFGEDESSDNVNERIDQGLGKRERGPDGKFLPKKSDATAATPAPAKPAVSKAAATPAPAAKVETPVKIKIGDEEKTAEEWAAYHKELAEKAGKPAEVAKVEELAKVEPKPEDIDAQRKQARDDWEKKTRENYAQFKPTQDQVDKALASGNPDELYEMFTLRPMLALEENIRLWVQNSVNPLFEQLDGQLSPIASSQQQLAQYQAENQFLAANPEIKAVTDADPAKLAVHRQVSEDLRQEMEEKEILLASNPNNHRAQARLDALSKDFLGEMARETKARYAAQGVAAASTPTQPAVPKKPAAPTERPLSGDRPGASTTIKTENNEQRLARELNEHQGV